MQNIDKCLNLRFSNDLYECVFNIWELDIPIYIAWENNSEYPLPVKGEWILVACDPYDPNSPCRGHYVMLARAKTDPRPEKRDPEGKKKGIHLSDHTFLPKPVPVENPVNRASWRGLSPAEAEQIMRRGGLENSWFYA